MRNSRAEASSEHYITESSSDDNNEIEVCCDRGSFGVRQYAGRFNVRCFSREKSPECSSTSTRCCEYTPHRRQNTIASAKIDTVVKPQRAGRQHPFSA